MNIGGFAVVFGFTAAVLLAAAVVGWLSVDFPAANLFAVVTAVVGLGSATTAVGYVFESPLLIVGTTIAVALLIPVPWVIFSFDYVGKEELVSTSVAVVLSVPVLLGLSSTIVLFVGQALPNVALSRQETTMGLLAVLITVLQLVQWGSLLYAGGLVLAGTGLVLLTFQRYGHLNSATGIALCTFGTVPWLAFLFGLQLEAISFLGFGTTIAVGYGFAAATGALLLGPPALFARVPAAGNVGPATIIHELEDPVVVTDREGQIVDVNAAARTQFGWEFDGSEQRLTDRLDTSLSALRDQQIVPITSSSGRVLFEPTVSDLTDQHGQHLGFTVVFRDVTTRQTRQQRLEVLNRVLRHNLRNDLSIILGYADVIRHRADEPAVLDGVDRISDTGQELATLSDRARKTSQALQVDGPPASTQLKPLFESLLKELRTEYDAEFSCRCGDDVAVSVDSDQLLLVFRSLIEALLNNNDSERPVVELRVEYDASADYPVTIVCSDNGDGISDEERAVIESGAETPLTHTSGMALWTVRWITTNAGGTISFADETDAGIALSFPDANRTPLTQRQP